MQGLRSSLLFSSLSSPSSPALSPPLHSPHGAVAEGRGQAKGEFGGFYAPPGAILLAPFAPPDLAPRTEG